MKRKIISCILSAALFLTAAPAGFLPAFAEETPDAASVQETAADETATSAGNPAEVMDDTTQTGAEEAPGEEAETPPSEELTEPEAPAIDTNRVFDDVQDSGAYYYRPVYWAVRKAITDGVGDNRFAPGNECTRAQIVTFLWRAAGSPAPSSESNPFTDVSAGAYYDKAVLWAVEKGITNGATADTFAPDTTCTRAQSVTFLYRYAEASVTGKTVFDDVKDSKAYYYAPVFWAVQNGITNGTSASAFSPDADCTRGQIVTFLYYAMLVPTENSSALNAGLNGFIGTVDGRKGTFEVKANAVQAAAGVREVRATVAPASNRDNVRWYTLAKDGEDSYSLTIDALERNGFDTYAVEWYLVTDAEQRILAARQAVTIEASNYAYATDIGDRQFRITIEGVNKKMQSIAAGVWSDEGGQDDIRWIKGTKASDTVWNFTVKGTDFKAGGKFLADLYGNDGEKEALLATVTFTMPAEYTVPYPKAEAVLDKVGHSLRAAFNWSASMKYYGHNKYMPDTADPGIEWYADYGFDNNKGNCYVMAATFYEMAVNLGYKPRQMSGKVPLRSGGLGPHSWVEIDIDGTTYVFDPDFTEETGRNGYMIHYGQSGTWRYQSYSKMGL